jgi:hypothetical protein
MPGSFPGGIAASEAIRNHRSYIGGSHGWLLGRFVVPVDHLESCRRYRIPHAVSHSAGNLTEDLKLLSLPQALSCWKSGCE